MNLKTPKPCPDCKGRETIKAYGSVRCVKCKRHPGWWMLRDAIDASEQGRALYAALKRPQTIAGLAEITRMSPAEVLWCLQTLQARGVNVQQFGDLWSLEKAPALGSSSASAAYRSDKQGRYRFGWISDNHLGSKYARLDVLQDIYRRFADAGIDRVFNAGNWIDGEARFNKYDLLVHGMDAQIDYLAEHYPQVKGLTTYAVAGDDHEGWYGSREGVDIGRYAASRLKAGGRRDWVNLGFMEAFVPLEHAGTGKTSQLHVVHPGGGTAYATSYTVQKLVEAYSGGSKPAVLLAGHYHKLEFINIRNVWTIQTGCTQDQTPFARKKKIHFALGGGICELEQDGASGAIIGCAVEMWCYFDRGFYNDRWSYSGPAVLPDASRHAA